MTAAPPMERQRRERFLPRTPLQPQETFTMANQPKPNTSHIEPSKHSTEQVDAFLEHTEQHVDERGGDGSPAVKPNKDLKPDGKPSNDTPENPRL
jgi:hypothetical protein